MKLKKIFFRVKYKMKNYENKFLNILSQLYFRYISKFNRISSNGEDIIVTLTTIP